MLMESRLVSCLWFSIESFEPQTAALYRITNGNTTIHFKHSSEAINLLGEGR